MMIDNRVANRFDLLIIITIASLAWGSYELLGALTPIRLIGLYGLVVAYKNRRVLKNATKGLSTLFCFWIIYSCFSVIFTFGFSSWLIQFCHTTTMMGAIMALSIWGVKAKNPLKSINYGWLLFVFLTMPIAIWELTTGNHLSSGSFNEDTIGAFGLMKPFAAVTFVNYNSYVVMLCIAAPFLYALLFKGGIIDRVCSLIALIFTFVVLAFNTSRGGIICFVISLFFYIIFTFLKGGIFKKVVLVTLLVLGSSFLISNFTDIELLEPLIRRSESTGLLEDDSRTDVWSRSIELSAKYLFIGTGCGSMPYALEHYYPSKLNFCHNYFLEILLEYGLVIFLVWFTKIFQIIRKNLKSRTIEIKYVALYALLSSPFLLVIDDYYSQRTGIWIYVASILLMYNYNKVSHCNDRY